jgi:hypothetical protein
MMSESVSRGPASRHTTLMPRWANSFDSVPPLRYFCSPHHALYPFIAQLERASGFARDEKAREFRIAAFPAIAAAHSTTPRTM